MKEQDFPHELSRFLFDFAEQLFELFPPNQNQPRNLLTAYLECVLYLVARLELLLQFMGIEESEKERLLRVILSQIEEEFGTANSTSVTEVISERMAQYERLFGSGEPFTEKWYSKVFSFYARCMDESMDDNRLFVWSLTHEPAGARLMDLPDIEDVVRQAEIEQVVTFQRMVINFFTQSDGDDDDGNEWK